MLKYGLTIYCTFINLLDVFLTKKAYEYRTAVKCLLLRYYINASYHWIMWFKDNFILNKWSVKTVDFEIWICFPDLHLIKKMRIRFPLDVCHIEYIGLLTPISFKSSSISLLDVKLLYFDSTRRSMLCIVSLHWSALKIVLCLYQLRLEKCFFTKSL